MSGVWYTHPSLAVLYIYIGGMRHVRCMIYLPLTGSTLSRSDASCQVYDIPTRHWQYFIYEGCVMSVVWYTYPSLAVLYLGGMRHVRCMIYLPLIGSTLSRRDASCQVYDIPTPHWQYSILEKEGWMRQVYYIPVWVCWNLTRPYYPPHQHYLHDKQIMWTNRESVSGSTIIALGSRFSKVK